MFHGKILIAHLILTDYNPKKAGGTLGLEVIYHLDSLADLEGPSHTVVQSKNRSITS